MDQVIKKKLAKMIEKDYKNIIEQDFIDNGYCPECGWRLKHSGGCKECKNPRCGFEVCG